MINNIVILNGAKYFPSRISHFVFIPTKEYIKYFRSTTVINSQKPNGLSEENIKNITESDCNFAPIFVDHNLLQDKDFNEHCLINNIYIPK